MTYVKNELNAKSRGGSELMAERLYERLDPAITDQFQMTLSRVRELDESKYRIYWVHDLPWDPELKHLSKPESIDKFHKVIFCGHWQYSQFQSVLGMPHNPNIHVINTGIVPFKDVVKEQETIRLIYTSTPQRGLDILVPVFDALCKKYDNIHLDVFSSFKIYGWEDADKQFDPLYQACIDHPNITYHGFQPNEVVREHLEKAHILAYPSTWMECSSASIIEAMSAGVQVVAPNFGGIPDTTGNLGLHYPWVEDKNTHAGMFYNIMCHVIDSVLDEQNQNYLKFIKMYADQRYNIDKIAYTWDGLLRSIINTAPSKSLPKSVNFFEYNTP
jgi:glycosyltransferase involved in cell wall biosynthesis